MKKILLFNYFLQKVAETEQKLLGTDDEKVALLAIIFSKANVFRRYISGCTSETIWSCQTQYAQDLFWAVLLDAKSHGDDLMKYYHPKASFLFGGEPQHGAPILEDEDVAKQCENIYPASTADKELYANFSDGEQTREILHCKTVDVNKMVPPTQDEDTDTEAIDRALKRLTKDKKFIELLDVNNKFSFYGRSRAHEYYAKKYAKWIPTVRK